MTPGVSVSLCTGCGWKGLPERIWCPACGGSAMRVARVHSGVVADVTTVRRAVGGPHVPIRLGEVRLDGGGTIIARLAPGAAAGMFVRLFDDGGATEARPGP